MSTATRPRESVFLRAMPPERLVIKAPRITCREINDGDSTLWFSDEIKDAADRAVRGVRMNLITSKSAKGARNATGIIACYFRREFGYDFVQYSADDRSDERDRVILLTQDYSFGCNHGVGAICFRWREWKNLPPGLGLAWLWLHPYLRNHGILSAYWPLFRRAYGDFMVEPPISSAMQGLLRKMGECPRCGVCRLCSDCRPCAAEAN